MPRVPHVRLINASAVMRSDLTSVIMWDPRLWCSHPQISSRVGVLPISPATGSRGSRQSCIPTSVPSDVQEKSISKNLCPLSWLASIAARELGRYKLSGRPPACATRDRPCRSLIIWSRTGFGRTFVIWGYPAKQMVQVRATSSQGRALYQLRCWLPLAWPAAWARSEGDLLVTQLVDGGQGIAGTAVRLQKRDVVAVPVRTRFRQ